MSRMDDRWFRRLIERWLSRVWVEADRDEAANDGHSVKSSVAQSAIVESSSSSSKHLAGPLIPGMKNVWDWELFRRCLFGDVVEEEEDMDTTERLQSVCFRAVRCGDRTSLSLSS